MGHSESSLSVAEEWVEAEEWMNPMGLMHGGRVTGGGGGLEKMGSVPFRG